MRTGRQSLPVSIFNILCPAFPSYAYQARLAKMRVARRREGETRGKGKAGGAKKASHRFVRIRVAYVRQARGKAHGRVARRREGESRGKGTGGGGVVPEGGKRWSVTPHPPASFRDLTPEGG